MIEPPGVIGPPRVIGLLYITPQPLIGPINIIRPPTHPTELSDICLHDMQEMLSDLSDTFLHPTPYAWRVIGRDIYSFCSLLFLRLNSTI